MRPAILFDFYFKNRLNNPLKVFIVFRQFKSSKYMGIINVLLDV